MTAQQWVCNCSVWWESLTFILDCHEKWRSHTTIDHCRRERSHFINVTITWWTAMLDVHWWSTNVQSITSINHSITAHWTYLTSVQDHKAWNLSNRIPCYIILSILGSYSSKVAKSCIKGSKCLFGPHHISGIQFSHISNTSMVSHVHRQKSHEGSRTVLIYHRRTRSRNKDRNGK